MENITIGAKELAQILGLAELTVKRKISSEPRSLPPSVKIGRKHLWLPDTVREWLLDRQSRCTTVQKSDQISEGISHVQSERRRPGRPKKQFSK